jgi:hypothetical protein
MTSSSSSVFDRLYSKSTESSRVRKSVAPVTKNNFLTRQDDDKKKPSMRKNRIVGKSTGAVKKTSSTSHIAQTIPTTGGIYDRLYSSGTASYNSKRKASGNEPRGPLKTKTNA